MLITLADMKAELGISDTSQDTRLTRMINSVGSQFTKITGRTFESTTYTLEEYQGNNTPRLLLKNYPVTAITKVVVNDEEITDYRLIDNNCIESMYFRSKTGYNLINDSPIYGAHQYHNIQITYTAGYASIPADIQDACIAEVTQRYNKYTQGNMQDIKSESLLSGSATYDNNSMDTETGLLKSTIGVLKSYTDVVIL